MNKSNYEESCNESQDRKYPDCIERRPVVDFCLAPSADPRADGDVAHAMRAEDGLNFLHRFTPLRWFWILKLRSPRRG